MTVAVHAEVMGQIKIMNNAGYFSNKQIERSRNRTGMLRHGFDLSKFAPNSLFFAPCQAMSGGHSFFKDFNKDGREALDPYFYINTSILDGLDEEPIETSLPVAAPVADVNADMDEATAKMTQAQKIDRAIGNFHRDATRLRPRPSRHDGSGATAVECWAELRRSPLSNGGSKPDAAAQEREGGDCGGDQDANPIADAPSGLIYELGWSRL